MMAVDWRNPVNSLDVSGDGFISPLDALQPINELNDNGPHALANERPGDKPYWDASGDQFISPLDALQVINALNANQTVPYVLGEGQQIAAEQSVTITVGQTTGTRTYRLQVTPNFDTTDAQASSDDLLAIYLVDPQEPATTLLDRGTPGTTLFTLAESGAEFAPGRVRWDGEIVEIDLSELTGRDTAELRLQLLNSDGDRGSRVAVRPLTNVVDPSGTIGPKLLDTTTPGAAGAAFNLAGLAAANDVNVHVENVRFSSATQRYTAELRLQNQGDSLGRSIAVAFPDLPNGVTLRNPSGTTPDGDPYVNFAPAIGRGGLSQNGRSEPLLVEFDDPTRVPFTLNPQILAGTNQPPTLAAVGPLTVMPGGKLATQLAATDPDGDVITFTLGVPNSAVGGSPDPLTLPTGTLHGGGLLEFTPSPDQLGQYMLDVIASDGALTTRQTVTLDVVADLDTTTRVSGFVLDVDQSPLVGMQVEIGAVQGLTQSDGSFTLDLGSGPIVGDTVKIRGELFTGNSPLVYPFIAEKLAFILEHEMFVGVNNVIARPIFLPPLDVAGGTVIDPMQDTTVLQEVASGEAVEVEVAAGTLMNQQGTPFTGTLSITEVPRELTPAALPDDLFPDLVVTIQPGEMVFASPAPLTFPNRSAWPAGALMDLWSINPVTGEFDDVGDLRVSSDGSKIETISGGVRNSSWHFPAPRAPIPLLGSLAGDVLNPAIAGAPLASGTCDDCADAAAQPANSLVEPMDGTILETHDLVSYKSLGESRGLQLVYDSLRADARPILHFGTQPNSQGFFPSIMATLQFSSGDFRYQVPGFVPTDPNSTDIPLGSHFWTRDASLSRSDIEIALQADLRNLPSGVYDFELFFAQGRLTQPLDFFGSGATQTGSIVHVNSIDSPLGSGWGFGGLIQLVPASDGSVLFIEGGGSEKLFAAPQTVGGPHGSPRGDTSTLHQLGDGTFRRTLKDQTVQLFNARNLLASETDGHGNVTRYDYDAQDRLIKMTDPVLLVTNIAYVPGGVEITDPASRVTRLDIERGNLAKVTDPDNSQRSWLYDNNHHMTSEIDQRGAEEHTHYGFHGRAIESVRKDGQTLHFGPAAVQGLLPAERTSADPSSAGGSPLIGTPPPAASTYADANGNVTRTNLDQASQAVSRRDAVGPLPSVQRDSNNRVTAEIDGRGNITNYDYDDRGNITSIRDQPLSGGQTTLYPNPLLRETARPQAIANADVDGDGNLDLITGYTLDEPSTPEFPFGHGQIAIHLNNSNGTFSRALPTDVGGQVFQIYVTNQNDDVWPDVLVFTQTNFGYTIWSLLGDEDARFLPPTVAANYSNLTGGAGPVEVADFDNDGQQDIAYYSFGVNLLFSNGDGTFSAGPQLPEDPGPGLLQPVDLDGDGTRDLPVTDGSTFGAVFGNGNGTFGTFVTLFVTSGAGWPHNPFVDIDGDGDLDFFSSAEVRLSNGNGTFADPIDISAAGLPVSISTMAIDVNHDSHVDLVIPHTPDSNSISIHLGNGDGTFAAPQIALTGAGASAVTVADFNADGLVDLATSNIEDSSLSVLLGKGDGDFRSERASFGAEARPRFVSSVDVTGDGVADLITTNDSLTNELGEPLGISVLAGLGDGTFAAPTHLPVPHYTDPVAVDDVDDDGDIDLVGNVTFNLTTSAPEFLVFLNDGSGEFMRGTPISAAADFITSRAFLTDLNNDGRPDLVNWGQLNADPFGLAARPFINQGSGIFSIGETFNLPDGTLDLRAGEFDGDPLIDLVALRREPATGEGQIAVFLNAGNVTFGMPLTSSPLPSTRGVIGLGDLDSDGDVDVINVEDYTNTSSVLLNQGDGTFDAPTTLNLPNGGGRQLTLGDLNGDGRLDLVTANSNGSTSVLLGNGDGTFGERMDFATGHAPNAILLSDLDGDSDPDLIWANQPLPSDPQSTASLSVYLTNTEALSFGVSTFTYESVFNQRTSLTDELGRQTRYDIDPANGNRLSETRVVGELDSVQNGETDDIVTRFTYTAAGLVDAVTDPLGRVTDNDYDGRGRLITIRSAVGTPDEITQRFEYDAAGNQTAFINEESRRTSYAYDELNRLTILTEADPDDLGVGNDGPLTAPRSTFEYDTRGNLIATTDPLGRISSSEYDPLDRLIRIVEPDPDAGPEEDGPLTSPITQFRYDPAGNLVQIVNPLAHVTRNEYDGRNRLARSIDANGSVTRFAYDVDDILKSVTDPNGNVTRYQYDARNRLVRNIDALGGTVANSYDSGDQLVNTTDQLGRTTHFEYDELGRLTREIQPPPVGGQESARTTLTYDKNDNLLSSTDALGHGIQYEYDSLDRQTAVIDPLGTTRFTYDAVGNLTSVTDPVNNVTQYEHDALNRLVREIDARGESRVFEYDAVANLVQAMDRNGRQRSFNYDNLNRQVRETWLDASQQPVFLIASAFDAAGRVTSIGDASSLVNYTYDPGNRLTGVTTTSGVGTVQLNYAYDAAGNMLSVTDRLNGTLHAVDQYAYDALNRVVRETQASIGTPSLSDKRVDLSYLANSQFDTLRRFSDLAGARLVAATAFDYDGANRFASIEHTDASAASVNAFAFLFDVGNRITAITDADGLTAYDYDALDQLISADHAAAGNSDEAYAYDENGNRTSGGHTIGPGNRLLSDGEFNYDYDDEGNLVLRTEIATGKVRQFTWDHRNRLLMLVDRDTPNGPATQIVDFTYDALDRRIAMAVDTNPADAVNATVTYFVYDGDNVMEEFEDADGDGPADAELTMRYLHGPAVDQVLAQDDGAGNVLWHLTDHLGTVRDLVDNTGALANHVMYDSFGQIISQTRPGAESRYLFTGREFDAETDLYYYRARYYDAETGRFLSEDPEFSANAFRYVKNNPVQYSDPSGRFEPFTILIISAVVTGVAGALALASSAPAPPPPPPPPPPVPFAGPSLVGARAISRGGGSAISRGGGSAISRGGGSAISRGGGSLNDGICLDDLRARAGKLSVNDRATLEHLSRAISRGGGSLSSAEQAELARLAAVISRGGGSAISRGGGSITAQQLARVLGNSSGNVLGNSSGNVLGNSSGNVLGNSSGNAISRGGGSAISRGGGSAISRGAGS